MPRFNDNEKKWIHHKLLTEGERLFSAHGIKKVTIDDLADAAGIAKVSFYTFYESKEYLYLDIVQNIQQQIFIRLHAILESNKDASGEDRVLQVFGAMYKMMLQYPILAGIDSKTIEHLSRKVSKDWLVAFQDQNLSAAQSLQDHGVRFTCDIQTVSHAFQAIYHSWMYLAGKGEEVQSAVSDILLRGVISQVVIK